MKTKDKIILESLKLLNEKGYVNTTTRDIAKSLNISPGNLHYHFKHSEEIIKELFNRFLSEMSNILKEIKLSEISNIEVFYNYIKTVNELFYEYKFLFLNFIDILRKIPEINQLYIEINISRKKEFEELFQTFQNQNIFRKDIPDFILTNIVEQIFILADNSLAYNELTKKLSKNEAIEHHTFLFMNQFYYLLTQEQQLEYIKKYVNHN